MVKSIARTAKGPASASSARHRDEPVEWERRRSAPDRGDVVSLQFTPQRGREQAGRRPALVLSPRSYNAKVGLAIFCPITSHTKGYPFEVTLPRGMKTHGVVLADHVKSLDWHMRSARFIERVPSSVLAESLAKLALLLG